MRAGISPTVKGQQQTALAQLIQLQAQAMQSGMNGVLADPKTLYRTTMRWLTLMDVDQPESLAIDPSSPAAQQAAAQMAQAAQQSQQQMLQAQQQLVTAQLQLEQAKLAEDARQADAKIGHDYYATDMQAEIAEAKIAGQGVIDLEKQRMAGNARQSPGGAETRAASTAGDFE